MLEREVFKFVEHWVESDEILPEVITGGSMDETPFARRLVLRGVSRRARLNLPSLKDTLNVELARYDAYHRDFHQYKTDDLTEEKLSEILSGVVQFLKGE